MKMTEKKTKGYNPPCIECFEAACEMGFAVTSLKYDENPSMGYGDNGEQWF